MEPVKRGRPPLYDPAIHPDALVEMMAKGMLDCEIYAEWGITRETFCKWKRDHEEFKEAHEEGMPKCEAVYVGKMRQCWLDGDDKGFKYCIALMNNKFGWGKDENTRSQISNTYNINNMQIVNTKEDYLQLVQDVRQQAKELNLLDIMPEDIIDVDESSQD